MQSLIKTTKSVLKMPGRHRANTLIRTTVNKKGEKTTWLLVCVDFLCLALCLPWQSFAAAIALAAPNFFVCQKSWQKTISFFHPATDCCRLFAVPIRLRLCATRTSMCSNKVLAVKPRKLHLSSRQEVFVRIKSHLTIYF